VRRIDDTSEIARMRAERLLELKVDAIGWRTLYRDRETGCLWEETYPHSEMHGGGPPRLTELAISSPDEWS